MMRKDQRAKSCASRRPTKPAPAIILAVALCSSASVALADGLQALYYIGEGYQSVKVITHFNVDPVKRLFDLYAAEPANAAVSKATEKQLAGQTAQDVCGNRTAPRGWTVRMFLPGGAAPVATCRTK